VLKPPRELSAAQLGKALTEQAGAGNVERLRELLGDRRSRAKKLLDAALLEAARGGAPVVIELLLDAGASANAKGTYGSALSYGLEHGVDFVRLMLARGASPNAAAVNDDSVLHQAVSLGRIDIARALLEAGADPNRSAGALTPLHGAARASLDADVPPEMVDLLVDHGARVDGKPPATTPLMWAVQDGRAAHVERLLARGADVNAVGRARQTALHLAFERGHDAIAKQLVAHGAERSLRDDTKLALDAVYGPDGDDVRACTIEYAPSDRSQRLDVALDLCVLRPAHLMMFQRPDFDAARWAELVDAGVAGGDRFAPETSRAMVLAPLELSGIKKPGVYSRGFALEISGVAPEFVRAMADALLRTFTVFTGAGHLAAVRVVAIHIRGSRTPHERVPDNSALRAFAGARPFRLRVERGDASTVLVRPRRAAGAAQRQLIARHVAAWLAMQGTWRRTNAWAGPAILVPHRTQARQQVFEIRAFGYEPDDAHALLANAMRALHARLPLVEVVLTTRE
jgi:ankyrin repeat protein